MTVSTAVVVAVPLAVGPARGVLVEPGEGEADAPAAMVVAGTAAVGTPFVVGVGLVVPAAPAAVADADEIGAALELGATVRMLVELAAVVATGGVVPAALTAGDVRLGAARDSDCGAGLRSGLAQAVPLGASNIASTKSEQRREPRERRRTKGSFPRDRVGAES